MSQTLATTFPTEGLERIRKDLERQLAWMHPMIQEQVQAQQRITESMAPMLESFGQVFRSLSPVIKQVIEMQKTFQVKPEYFHAPSRTREVRYFPMPTSTARPTKSSTEKTKVVALPSGARWDDGKLALRFKDNHTITVLYSGKRIGDYSHEQLGFARMNTRDKSPDKQWAMLQLLAITTKNKNLFRDANDAIVGKKKSAYQKTKESLSKKLQRAFSASGDPFLPHDQVLGYRLAFATEPEATLRGNGELHRSGGRLLEEFVDGDILN